MMDGRDFQSEIQAIAVCVCVLLRGYWGSWRASCSEISQHVGMGGVKTEGASAYLYAKCTQKEREKKLCPATSEAVCLSPLGVTENALLCFINWRLNMDPMPRLEF